ncbi:class I SAM-dependent methyltransferase [Nocardioides sp. KIGAM211]|uniref:Class I SAM-dependent methyltransferase n=1 Tax=Nocardioides luti TaxID=2761101 RepID=A0A7X0VBR2_9ACTN|nr:class I SAM-dependent methyltransferase [Nocardioides luti]MBB6628695.1 class I SAM-dependent methyltransferase [Nocardioides luti]
MTDVPPVTRWASGGRRNDGYGRKFAELVDDGADVDGEARLADALLPRGARVLDAGAGMGRVGAALAARGHRVVAAEPDAALVAQARRTYPDLEVVESDILGLSADLLAGRGLPPTYDLVVCVGNVMIYLAEATERDVLARLRGLLAPGGRVLVGFHPVGGPTTSRTYPPAEFAADAEASGLRVDLRAGSYQLHPADEGYAVWVLSRADDGPVPTSFGHPTVLTPDP